MPCDTLFCPWLWPTGQFIPEILTNQYLIRYWFITAGKGELARAKDAGEEEEEEEEEVFTRENRGEMVYYRMQEPTATG